MVKKLIFLLILTLFLFSVIAVTAFAKSRIVDERTEKLSQYGFMYEKKANLIGTHDNIQSDKYTPAQNLGTTGDGVTPGIVVAHTWYDYQCNSSTSRLIDWRAPNPQIHMSYTQIFAVGAEVERACDVDQMRWT